VYLKTELAKNTTIILKPLGNATPGYHTDRNASIQNPSAFKKIKLIINYYYTDKLLQLMIDPRARSSLSQEGNSAPAKFITQIGSMIRPMTHHATLLPTNQ
jgi:hypothetical protein